MNSKLKNMLASLHLLDAQTYKNITVFPLAFPGNGAPHYLTLGEAIEGGFLVVTEVSQGGSVPELKVINRASQPVLLMDGEELVGAKQNRAMNTSILLKENSETTIPVSCTEHGRWSHVSPAFADSGVVMAHKSRARKSRSVSESLSGGGEYASNQGEVWANISALLKKAQTSSATEAMRDVFEARQTELAQSIQIFSPQPSQNGLLVLIDGEVAGLDFVSSPEAYLKLHAKLLKSYIIEALVEPKPVPIEPGQAKAKAEAFLQEAAQCEEKEFPSGGYGVDVRFQKQGIAGTALVYGDVVHSALFRLPTQQTAPEMAPLRSRRRFIME